jgi:outer membrane receptor protein involved in Fe transport
MGQFRSRKSLMHTTALAGALAGSLLATGARAESAKITFDVPAQPLGESLRDFYRASGEQIVFSENLVAGRKSQPVRGDYTADQALAMLLEGTSLTARRSTTGVVMIEAPQGGSAASGGGNEVEALIVTAQKREEDIQDVPIAISAFSQEALERSQIAGGPDLMTQIPNMTFTKTNFSTYSIQIRGIGTQAISATTDAAVAVAFNNTPFIRNRFFEQEFYDLQRVEVLRGPQGTLYGRNATAGVVNIISRKPKFGYEAKLSADVSNYSSTRLEGMLNIPLAEDKAALRIAGAWTKRQGYTTNEITGNPIDGRDLWSSRASLRLAPIDTFDLNLIWEHFEENDDRLRSGKQLCHQDRRRTGHSGYSNPLNQGCLAASLYSPDSYEAPNGYSLPYFLPLGNLNISINTGIDPYLSLVQSRDLRVIESTIDPEYRAKSDLVEAQWSWDVGENLTLTSETAYLYDTIFSLQDFNRFNTAPGAFSGPRDGGRRYTNLGPDGTWVFCDPQLGCSDRLMAVDVSRAKSSHFSQEFRLSSDYDGSFNFSLGGNFLRYDTEEKYYVFINTLSMFGAQNGPSINTLDLPPWEGGVTDNRECFGHGLIAPDPTTYQLVSGCLYVDPNPIESVNDMGHNYFLSKNPYKLISYAVFGEAYYNIAENLKLTAGLRWTVDRKEAPRIPSWLLGTNTAGLSVLEVQEQEWREPTGRLTLDWKPNLAFTDETLVYASFARGYKAGGSNPPPTGVVVWGIEGIDGDTSGPIANAKVAESATKPRIFEAEFVHAFEVGAKNTLLDGALTLNLAAFYYDYKGYQVSQIIDRSAVNYNFDSKVWGLEIEADWRPLENLRLGFKGGYENTEIADGERAIDIMDRTAGQEDWMVVRPFPTFPSNCVLPTAVFAGGVRPNVFVNGNMGPCEYAYVFGLDPVTLLPYVENPTQADIAPGAGDLRPLGSNPFEAWADYAGFNPTFDYGNNGGEGFYKELGGNELPNAPHFTATVTADYTMPLPGDWLMTLHTDLYYQSEAWSRVFNTEGYDKLKAFTNVNVAAIFTNENAGWKVMAYVKNVFDKDNITGSFLNSDDTGLTTNVFLVEPRLYGLRVTKEWSGGPWWTGANSTHTGPYPLTIELGGQVQRHDAPYAPLAPDFVADFSEAVDPTNVQNRDLDWGDGREVRLAYRPGTGPWSVAAGLRYGRGNASVPLIHASEAAGPVRCGIPDFSPYAVVCDPDHPFHDPTVLATGVNWSDASAREREEHNIVDFEVGRDFGLGALDSGRVAAGLRHASFESMTATAIDGIPDMTLLEGWAVFPASRNHYRTTIEGQREFEGWGPTLTAEAAHRLLGGDETGSLNVEWKATAGLLFGKQEAAVTGTYASGFYESKYTNMQPSDELPLLTPGPIDVEPRSADVEVPVLDLSLGLSYAIQRLKVGAGYRWERYFDVLDVGYDKHQDADRTIDGPYFKIAVGFGG